MIEVVVGRGDATEARELVAAMRLYESAGYRPIPDSNAPSDRAGGAAGGRLAARVGLTLGLRGCAGCAGWEM